MQCMQKEWRRSIIQVLGRLDGLEKKEIIFMRDTKVMANKMHYNLEYMI